MARRESEAWKIAKLNNRTTFKGYFIAGFFAVIAAGIVLIPKKGASPVPSSSEMAIFADTIGPIFQAKNAPGGVINQIGTINYGDTSKKKPSKPVAQKPTTVIDQSVTSYFAQPGSITAREVNVSVRNEEEIDNSRNFTCRDSFDIYGNHFLVIAPLFGVWYKPFIAVNIHEYVDSTFRLFSFLIRGDTITSARDTMYAKTMLDGTVSKDNPMIVYIMHNFRQMAFGDISTPKKQYVRLRRY